MHTSTC